MPTDRQKLYDLYRQVKRSYLSAENEFYGVVFRQILGDRDFRHSPTSQLYDFLVKFAKFIADTGGIRKDSSQWPTRPEKAFEEFVQSTFPSLNVNKAYNCLFADFLYSGSDDAGKAQKYIAKAMMKRDIAVLYNDEDAFDKAGNLTQHGIERLTEITARYQKRGDVKLDLPSINDGLFRGIIKSTRISLDKVAKKAEERLAQAGADATSLYQTAM